MALAQEVEHFTYSDYLTWDDSDRYEIIDGFAYAMSPAPTPAHQSVSGGIYRQLASFLADKPCKVFYAPLDVRLDPYGMDDTVVQPDITVVCDKRIIAKQGIAGVPTMVVEVLSPTSVSHDTRVKFELYRRFGVPEYWIVDPEHGQVQVHNLRDGEYFTRIYGPTHSVPVTQLSGCVVDFAEVFAEADVGVD